MFYAAMLMQVSFGNFTPAFGVKGAIRQHFGSILALPWKNPSKLEADIMAEWRKLVGLQVKKTKFRFVQCVRNEKLYGVNCYRGKYSKRDAFLGISKNSVLALDPETLCLLEERELHRIVSFRDFPRGILLDWGSGYLQFETSEGGEILDLVQSYLSVHLRQRSAAFEEGEYAENCAMEKIP